MIHAGPTEVPHETVLQGAVRLFFRDQRETVKDDFFGAELAG